MSPRILIASPPRTTPLSHAAAALLRAASVSLARLAEWLTAAAQSTPSTGVPTAHVEFHAEAGAPEGALYADGVLIGLLPGVTRL